jgi:hypothetical protein
MEQQEPTFEFIKPPKIKGWYVLGSTNKSNTLSISLTWKPKWLHRQMMKIFFGWYWVDEK